MATGALSSRARVESASVGADGGRAGAAWGCFMGVRPRGCKIIGLAFPAAQRSSGAEMSKEAHFEVIERLRGWRMHHSMRVKTANCVATIRSTPGLTAWV